MLIDFIEILTEYRIKFPSNMMLLSRALIAMEGIGRQLDPSFNMVEHLRPFTEKIVKDRYSPANLSKELTRTVQSYQSLGKNLPKDIKEFINRVNRNKFKIDLEHRGLERLITDLDKSTNRISFSMVIAALIIGSSIIMQTDKGPILFGFPVLGLLGFISLGWYIQEARAAVRYDEMVLFVLLGVAIIVCGDVLSAVARLAVRRSS